MSTVERESLVKNCLDQHHPRKLGARKPNHPLRGHRHLVTLSEEELSRREHGWNDRFSVDPPPKSNKAQSPAHSPTFSTPPTPLTKESRIHSERAQYGKRGGKRNREPKKTSSGKLAPLGTLPKLPSEAAQSTKEEKLRFKVLKAIDARETLLYQLSALILCTPTQESLFLPARPTGPPTSTSAGRQQMRSRGGMTLASNPLSRHGGNPGVMTNTREATKLAQQLATDLQVTGIQCVEALVEWMLEAGAQAETPPPFLWRGRNYFLKMVSDLDFAESELQARGVNLDCFKQHNPLLVKPNQKLGRVLAAHSIIMEMVEFAKDMSPRELLALSGRMREETENNTAKVESHMMLGAALGAMDDNNDPAGHIHTMEREQENFADKQVLARRDHESAADLVNLLDESFDFIRVNGSHERDTNPTEPSSENEHEDDGDNNKGGASEERLDRPPSGKSVMEDDSSADKLEPEEGDKPRTDALDLEKEEGDMPTDNQSDYEEDSVDGNAHGGDQSNVETPAPDSVSEVPKTSPENTDENDDPAHVSNSTLTEELSSGTEQEVPAFDHEQRSSRTNTSDNQSEYDNSFAADAGDEDGEREASIVLQQAGEDIAPDKQEITNPDKPAAPEENSQNEAVEVARNSPVEPSAVPETLLTSRTEDNGASEYDNSFEEDADEGEPNDDLNADRTEQICDSVEPGDATTTLGNVPSILGVQQGEGLMGIDNDNQSVPKTDDAQTVSKSLVDELKRWTFLEDESRPTEVNARECLAWSGNRALTEALQRHSSISECMEGSIISMLKQYGLAVPGSPLESLLCCGVGQELDLATFLLDECLAVLGDICSVAVEAMQRSIQSKNSLVSEIEIEEILEIAEAVRQEYHESTWAYLKIASTLSIFLHTSDNSGLAPIKGRAVVSAGLSSLVKVFYPYMVNQPREELTDNWHPVSSVLAAMELPVDRLYLMLDPMCKTLLLAVEVCRLSNQDAQDKADLVVFPKVTVVCDREDVLQSSVEYVWRNHLSSEKVTSNFSLFPFFKSSFGEKLVDGVMVEEGEGKGPLKEWFGLVGTQLASKWKQLPASRILSERDSTQVTVSGNVITIPGAAEVIRPGFRLEWETSVGETTHRVVNKSVENDTFLLDRSVPSHSFATSQLRISQPSTAIFEYVQGSERYWLNESTRDSAETRNVLVFVGWFLASAISHFSTIQLQVHPLFFRLLLNPQHCVTLEEIRLFDPQLFKSLSGMKDMKPGDFAEYLKFEGADDSLSVDAYIGKALEEKFGPASGIGWQLQSVRRGFTCVISIEQLGRVGIAEADLVEIICGGSAGCDDFVIKEVFRVAADTDFSSCGPLMNAFWQAVNGFEPQLKRKFIKFVTGVDTLPLAGTEFLRIEMPFTAISAADHEKCLQMLPQAHTCDNTLELPHYWKALCWREQHDEHESSSKLEEELALLLGKKLRDAVEYSSGYGLDGTSAVKDVFAVKSVDDDAELAKEESYDSLGLPALSEGQSTADLPIENSLPSPQTSDHHEAEQEEVAPAESEIKPEPPAPVVSPRPDESYEEYDWEEESVS